MLKPCFVKISVLLSLILNPITAFALPKINLISPQPNTGVTGLTPAFAWSASGTGTLDNVVYVHTTSAVYDSGTANDVDELQTFTQGSDLSAGTIYYWGVKVTDDDGTSFTPVQAFTVLAADRGGTVSGAGRTFATADYPISVCAVDMDGDGNMDLVSASRNDYKIAWHRNDGSANFTENVIGTNASGARCVYAADVDGDGDMDALSASLSDNKIAWYENDGSEGFTEHVISASANGAYAVYTADVDGDGDMDVLGALAYSHEIVWYENDGSEGFTAHTVSSAIAARSVYAVDVDGDGDMDILSASANDYKVAWCENDGSEGFTEHVISDSANGASWVHAADVDGDGDMDVLSTSYYDDKVAWYENDGSESFTEHAISTNADYARWVRAVDMDGDGDMDVLSVSSYDHKVAWYENDGSENFTEHVVTTNMNYPYSGNVADVDGDGDMDVLCASSDDDAFVWFENATTPDIVSAIPDTAANENFLPVVCRDLNDVFNDAENGSALAFSVNTLHNMVTPYINTDSVLVLTPVAGAFGTDTLVVSASDGVLEAKDTVVVTVHMVNDAPGIDAVGDPAAILEDAGEQTIPLSGISDGDANDVQAITITAVSSDTSLIPDPAVLYASDSTTGYLTYTPVPDANGTATITVTVRDDGGAAHGGVDTTLISFDVAVTAVNDAPSCSMDADLAVDEDCGMQYVPGWAMDISAGPADENGQTLSWTVTGGNSGLFSTQPVISSAGDLVFTPAADSSGTATVYVRLTDDGGTADGGVDSGGVDSFTVTVAGINDAPSFTPGSDRTVEGNAGPQTVSAWATGISAGPANESGQTLTFNVITDNDALFATLPAVDAAGELTFAAADDSAGSAVVSVQLKDDGGTADGGIDSTETVQFTITVEPVNIAPVVTSATADTAHRTVPYYYTVAADDPGDTLTYALANHPAWLHIGGPVVYGTPPDSLLTDTSFTVIATDGELSDTVTVQLAVLPGDGKVPVDLTSFTAGELNGTVLLEWTTQSELDNLGWDVRRGTSPVGPFQVITGSIVSGAGSTQQPQSYAFTDTTAGTGLWYYQLVQYDMNGDRQFSYVVAAYVGASGIAETGSSGPFGIRVTNPAGAVDVTFDARYAGTVRVLVTDVRGRVVHSAVPRQGAYHASGLEPGIYYVMLDDGSSRETVKVLLTE